MEVISYMGKEYTPALAYDSLTNVYDTVNRLLGFGPEFMRGVVRLADIQPHDRVLDVGTGTGTLLVEARKLYPDLDIVGIDPDPKSLQIARGKLERVHQKVNLVRGSAQNLPFDDNSFDLATSTLIFHHLPTPVKRKALGEIYRVLDEDGRFLLADFGKPENIPQAVLLHAGSLFDGRENMRANLDGKLPEFLEATGFHVREVAPRRKGVQFLLATK